MGNDVRGRDQGLDWNTRLVNERFTRWQADYLADAGVPYSRLALELLFLIPEGFAKSYKQLFESSLGPVDSGADARGKAAERTGATGRAKGKAGGDTGKRWKNLPLTIRDEDALELKQRIDKKLRTMAREIIQELDEIAAAKALGIKRKIETGEKTETGRCRSCGKFSAAAWNWCPNCGTGLNGDDQG